jgi:hypothetical protein
MKNRGALQGECFSQELYYYISFHFTYLDFCDNLFSTQLLVLHLET